MSSLSLAGARPVVTTTVFMVAMAFAGCGGGGDGTSSTAGSAPTTTQTQSTTTTATSPQATAADRKAAQAALMRLSDFPSGWEESDSESPSEKSKCPGIQMAKEKALVHEASPDFNKGDNTTADNVINVYADEAGARAGMAAMTSRENRECIRQLVSLELVTELKDDDVDIGEVTTGQVSVPAGVGDDRTAIRVTIPLSTQGYDVDAILDVDVIRVGRAVNILELGDSFTPFDEDLHERLARRTTARLRASLAAAESE